MRKDQAELIDTLLTALKHCVIDRDEWLTEARAAIAKAEARRPETDQAEAPKADDEQAAVDFYTANPRAALFDLRKRLAAPVPAQAVVTDEMRDEVYRKTWAECDMGEFSYRERLLFRAAVKHTAAALSPHNPTGE